ncbi:hypothetical protein JCM15519_12970 [Fundidesulfovibrio butyratiphilus]
MKHLALVFTLILAGLALTACGAKKTDSTGKTLLGAHVDFKSVPSGHGDGKMLDIDAGVTVDGSEFGFVTSGNGSYVKGVKGMDPTMEGALPPDQVYDPLSEPEPTPLSTPLPDQPDSSSPAKPAAR